MPVLAANPFYQPARQWQIRIAALAPHVGAIEEAFSDLALAISSFEVEEATGRWTVDILTDRPPENVDIPARLALVAGLLDIPGPSCEVKELPQEDWVAEVERGFPPLNVGRFYVHGAHIADAPPPAKIALSISAGLAFGSGEHATTSGCLLALGGLAKRRCFQRPLDMGCGSGILAIAMAKLWHCPVLGIDIDPVSVQVARANARINRTHALTDFFAGDGYRSRAVGQGSPFDCITANILATPLTRMAPLLARHLAKDGVAILSGLLASQERMVLAAHRAQGLTLRARIVQNGWHTLIVGR